MSPSGTLELCTCTTCFKTTWKGQDGKVYRGNFQKKGVIRDHLLKDERSARTKHAGTSNHGPDGTERDEEGRVSDAVFLSTVLEVPPPPGEFAPSRSRLRTGGNITPTQKPPSGRHSTPNTARGYAAESSRKHVLDADASSTTSSGKRQRVDGALFDADNEMVEKLDDSNQAQRVLAQTRDILKVKKHRISKLSGLRFQTPPRTLDDCPSLLDLSHPDSQQFEAHLGWLQASLQDVYSLKSVEEGLLHDLARAVEAELQDELQRAADWKAALWDEQRALAGLYGGVDPELHASAPLEVDCGPLASLPVEQPWIYASLIAITALHTLSSVSRAACNMMLKVIRLLLFGALTWQQTRLMGWSQEDAPSSELSPELESLLQSVPVDIRTATKHLGLEPQYTLYACCPECFATYSTTPQGTYPKNCTHQPTPSDPPCGAELLKPGGKDGGAWVPKKPFPLHSLRHWLGRLLSRKGLEDLLDKAWEVPPGCEDEWTDIMHAPGIRQFKGPDGSTLFSMQPEGTYHLVFSLFIDWFNPFGNKSAGKSHSIGAIYMVCLNLPPEMRYLPENIFLAGIIPRPCEPSQEQINHVLRPLMDELLVFWQRGVHVSKTAKRPHGYNICAAVVPLVCDLPAARKAAGFSGHSSSNVCSFCDVRSKELNNLDRGAWKRRTYEEHLAIATAWRDAPDQRTRDRIYSEHGVRWSEMLRLPYWDPTRYTVVDAMHNLYLGELHHHCEVVFGILDSEPVDEEKKTRPHTPEEQTEWLQKVAEALSASTHHQLLKARKGYLVAFAALNNVPFAGETKQDYAIALHNWYKTKASATQVSIPEALAWNTSDFKLLNSAEELSRFAFIRGNLLAEIREDITKTSFPSWINRPPRNFGKPSQGKLTADQWRTAATTCLVITLVRHWGASTASEGHRNMLQNYMHLVVAVLAATSKTMSKDRARFYDAHMHQYLVTLVQLYQHKLVPNHHMALHLGECLELFGPVQSWWAFPFERYNGIIAKLNTNHKSAEMPVTFLRNFCIGANLRALMSRVPWPSHSRYTQFLEGFREVIGDGLRGLPGISSAAATLQTYSAQKATELPRDVYNAILWKINSTSSFRYSSAYDSAVTELPKLGTLAQPAEKVTIAGMQFTRGGGRRGEASSLVIFKNTPLGGMQYVELPGQIHHVFHHSRKEGSATVVETFLVIRRYLSLSEDSAQHDLYRIWEGLPAKLYYNAQDPTLYVVRVDEIVSHFMSYKFIPEGIEGECILVFPTPKIVHR